MVTINAIDSNIPIELSKGGTNATSFATNTGIVKYDGTSLVTSSTALIDSSNRMTNTSQPAFLAYLNTTVVNVTGDGTVYTVIFDTEVFDQNSNFNLATSTFTSPLTSKINFTASVYLTGGTVMSSGVLSIVTSNRTYKIAPPYANGGVTSTINGCLSVLADMDAADVATVTIVASDTGGKIDDVLGNATPFTFFSGYIVC